MTNPVSWLLRTAIRLYRLVPKRAETCRYYPSCSAYALQAIEVHGALKGTWLTVRRVSRCHPWGGTGLDPVPPRRGTHEAEALSMATPPSIDPDPIPAGGRDAHREEHH